MQPIYEWIARNLRRQDKCAGHGQHSANPIAFLSTRQSKQSRRGGKEKHVRKCSSSPASERFQGVRAHLSPNHWKVFDAQGLILHRPLNSFGHGLLFNTVHKKCGIPPIDLNISLEKFQSHFSILLLCFSRTLLPHRWKSSLSPFWRLRDFATRSVLSFSIPCIQESFFQLTYCLVCRVRKPDHSNSWVQSIW